MKKFSALLAALMLVVAMLPGTAMAYEVVRPDDTTTPTIEHTLKLTDNTLTSLAYGITYSFTAELVKPTTAELPNLTKAVSGVPTISSIVYDTATIFDQNKTCTKELEINWNDVSISEPGIYVWKITQSVTCEDNDPLNDPSNTNANKYLHVYVLSNGNELLVSNVFMTSSSDAPGATGKDEDIEEQYPAVSYDLSVSKNVAGNQSSTERYFQFEVSLTAPEGAAQQTYQITSSDTFDVSVPETAYHGKQTNPTSVTLVGGTETTFIMWLKHGQSFTIKNMLYGTSYTITEAETDYTTTSAVSGTDSTVREYGSRTVSDGSLEGSVSIAYTNTKSAFVPTGIALHTAAPMMGILLAMSLLAILFIGKRKESAV